MLYKNRLGGHVGSYHTYSLEEALEGIAAAGFRFVELSAVRGWNEHIPLEADQKTLSGIQRLLNRLGLVPISLSGHSDLTSKQGLKDGKKALDICERMGIDLMNTAIGGHYKEREDLDGFMANIGALADYAEQRHIMIGLEIHGEITNSGKNAVPVIKRIARDNVKINYDTANVEFYSGVTAMDDVKYAVKQMVHCHLKDTVGGARVWNFPTLGKGHVDFAKVLATLKRDGFSGPMSVELEFSGEPWPPLKAVNAAMKQSYKTLSALGLA